MGICFSNSTKNIKVATLNYSGILKSPFEFYSKEDRSKQQQINKIFHSLMEKNQMTKKEKFKWEMGPIDKNIQSQRYSPVYVKGVGVVNGKILSRFEFNKKWDDIFEQIVKATKFQCTQLQKTHARLFDGMCFQAFLIYVYKVNNQQQVQGQNADDYLRFCEHFFSKAFICEDIKVQKIMEMIDKLALDILFLQQTNMRLINQLQDLIKGGKFIMKDLPDNESVIVVRKQKFDRPKNEAEQMLKKLTIQQVNRMNWNKDTAFMFIDDLILISSHISSKKTKNSQQIDNVYEDLTKLQRSFPQHKIILGFDANNDALDPEKISPQTSNDFSMIPSNKNDVTVAKKRTLLQAQTIKADQIAAKRSDYIITNAQISTASVGTIQGRQVRENEQLLPSQEHPFDHFMVIANLRLSM